MILMIETPLTKLALSIATRAHAGQVDKAGLPYIEHPIHVASSMETEAETCAALLHDVVEDTDLTFEDLASAGIPSDVINALKLLTHDSNIPYLDYVRQIKTDPIALKVKLSDLRHNSDASRLAHITEKDEERLRKYARAIAILESD